ncbi:hypothetical protein, partial [Paraburkholderia tropica]
AGAGLASKMAGTLNDISKGVASATGSDLIGNLAANIAAGVGGAAVGGTAGAAMGSNVHLYNQTVDDERALTGEPGTKSLTLADYFLAGVKTALDLLPFGFGGGRPPAAGPGAVLVNGAGHALAAGISSGSIAAGYGPGNATLNSGDNEQSFGGKSINELSDAGKVPDPSDKSGELSGAGRALQKHGGRDGSAFPSAKGNPTAINEQGQKIIDDILNDPGSTVIHRNTGRFGDVIDVTAPDGRGLRYSADGKFITFLEPKAK